MPHTPGPWIVDGFADCQLITKDVPPAIGRPIGIGKIYSPNMIDDARLMAAAPKLLDALQKAAPFVGWASTRQQIIAGVDAGELCGIIDAVLAEATEGA